MPVRLVGCAEQEAEAAATAALEHDPDGKLPIQLFPHYTPRIPHERHAILILNNSSRYGDGTSRGNP
jgi:hypothetical protein